MPDESVGKKLSELRVCDLKEELEKRKLEITGNKNALVERLQKALQDEGHDPDKFLFGSSDKKSPLRKSAVKVKTEIEEKVEEEDNSTVVVDEVGTVDNEDFDEHIDSQNNDTSMNDNEESINLTIEEDEQKLLHDQAQDEKDKKKTNDDKTDGGNNGDAEEEEEEEEEDKKENVTVKKEKEDGEKDTKEEKSVEEKKKDDSDQKTSAKSTTVKDEKEKTTVGAKSKASSSRNLWVSGLSSITRASDLKTIFSKCGKVIGAKVVTNTRTPGTRCYGYVTMASSADATRSIEHLHRTELHGRIISVERTKNEIGSNVVKREEKKKSQSRDRRSLKSEDKENKEKPKEKREEIETKKAENNPVEKAKSVSSRRDSTKKAESPLRKKNDSKEREREREREKERERERERERRREREVLSFQKIREERERQRLREKERQLREEERRRRDIRRRQREEEKRLTLEREKLQLERERLEREKAELLRLERERQKLEREKIELERLELKRQQMKIMQQSSRIEEPKRAVKRTSDDRYTETDRKRPTTDRRFEPPPPPRFDSSIASYDRSSEKKRDEYTSSKRDDYKRDDYKREIEVPPPRHSSNYHGSRSETTSHKSNRYPEPDRSERPDPRPSNFRRSDDRGDPRNTSGKRYGEVSSYAERQGGGSSSQWHSHNSGHSGGHSGPPAIKSFTNNTIQSSSNVPSWQTKSADDHGWRPVDSSQDRYDRTYNERSGPYMESSRQSGMFMGRPQDRYGGQISRYENGKY